MDKGLIIVISAPSGTGKSSICRHLLKVYPEIEFSVSYTSRQPRPGEVNGKDYHFISRDDFKQRIGQDEFVEWVENYGNFYGTSTGAIERVLNDGKDLLEVERLRRPDHVQQLVEVVGLLAVDSGCNVARGIKR